MSIYYILYDSKRIHWFSVKEKTDKRNLRAIYNKIEKYPDLINEEITLSEDIEITIKSSLLSPIEDLLPLIRIENPYILPILFPEDLILQ